MRKYHYDIKIIDTIYDLRRRYFITVAELDLRVLPNHSSYGRTHTACYRTTGALCAERFNAATIGRCAQQFSLRRQTCAVGPPATKVG
jgi:hypothetical protein